MDTRIQPPIDDVPEHAVLARYTRALSVAMGHHHLFTWTHSERVRDLAQQLGRACAMTLEELRALDFAAAFHDFGKLGIPDSILSKPGRLNAAERALAQRHAVYGEEILLATEIAGADAAAHVVRQHHECFDGSGYPDGLAGEDIPLAARIVGIVNSYDAMAEERTHHSANPHRQIVATLTDEMGSKHDPQLLKSFLRIIASSPLRAAGA